MVQVSDLVTRSNLLLLPDSITSFTSICTVTTYKMLLGLTVMEGLGWQNVSIVSSEFVTSGHSTSASTEVLVAVPVALLPLCAGHP